MANDRGELCFLLLLFTGLSVVFYESEGVHVTKNVQDGLLSIYELMLKCLSEIMEQIRYAVLALAGTMVEVLLNLTTFLFALKETVLPEELCISFLHWLYHYSVQIILYGAIFYLVYNIHKESRINSKLMKDFRILSNSVGHVGWQVDAHKSEMNAIENRLKKNKEERIPSILGKLEALHDMEDKQQTINKKFNDEMRTWKPNMEEQINKLTILNQKLYGSPDNEITRKIRAVGWNAGKKFEVVKEMLHDRIVEARMVLDETSRLLDIKGKKFEVVKEMLHDRIVEARMVLDETSRLLDIKGLPLKVNYDMEYEFR